MESKETVLTTNLRNIAEAFAFAVQAGFMHREHAQTIFKTCLRVAGMEIPNDDKKIKVKGVKE